MKSILSVRLMVMLVAIMGLSACHSMKHTVEVNDNDYPMSKTPKLYSMAMTEIGPESYTVNGTFRITKNVWSLGVGRFPVTPASFDLTSELNQAVRDRGGNAIVNLNIQSETTMLTRASGVVAMFFATIGTLGMVSGGLNGEWDTVAMSAGVASIGLLMPGWNKLIVTGEVVTVPEY
jgi:hypothetical protein